MPCFHSQIPRGRHPTQPLELKLLRGIKEFKTRGLVFFVVGSLWNINLNVVFEYSSVLIKIHKYFIIPLLYFQSLKEIKSHRLNPACFLKGGKLEFRVLQRSMFRGNLVTSAWCFSP